MKNNTKAFLGLLTTLFFSMCTSPKQKIEEGLPTLDVANALNAALPDTFTWNNIAKEVRMIPLKTEHLIGGNPDLHYFSDNLIIVSDDATNRVFIFDGEGQEKLSFSHYGQGPKEYIAMTSINYHERDSLIMLYDNDKKRLFRFNLEGKFVDARPVDTDGTILKIDPEGYIFSLNRTGTSFVSIWDDKLQPAGEYLPFDTLYTDQQKINCYTLSGKGTISDAVNLLPACSDTVYSITKAGAEPQCVLKRGSYKCSPDDLNNAMKVLFKPDHLNAEQICSFSSYFYYMTGAQMVVELWDMQTGELLAWNKGEQVGPERDLVFGLRYVLPSGNEIRPWKFDYIAQDSGIFIVQAEECLDDIKGLTDDDNPVLIVLDF